MLYCKYYFSTFSFGVVMILTIALIASGITIKGKREFSLTKHE